VNVLGAIFTLLFCALVFVLPRKNTVLGVYLAVCYVTQGQIIDVFGFNFHAIRIVLLATFIRLLIRGELSTVKWNPMDVTFLLFVCVITIASSIRTGAWQESAGSAYNLVLSYLAFRGTVSNIDDFRELVPKLAVLIVPLALLMLYEAVTGKNLFNIFGGQEWAIWSRGERFRCIGCFRGPHTAGIFGATLMPFFFALFWAEGRRILGATGLISATLITYTSNSSGPLMAYLSAAIALLLWRFRDKMRLVRRGLLAAIFLLALTMKAPIWYILAKISDIIGGDGWSRSYLMDQCFKHFFDWWIIGTDDTANWASTTMPWGGADLCNLYVSCAATGGLAALVLFLALLTKAFKLIGFARQKTQGLSLPREVMFWALGAALFAHVMALFSVAYFDQLHVPWWGLFGVISSSASAVVASDEYAEQEDVLLGGAECAAGHLRPLSLGA
jgi:hypothetical protein